MPPNDTTTLLNDEFWSTLQNGVRAINELNTQIQTTFSSITLSTTAPAAGTITFNSSQARAFMSVTTSTNGVYYIALY